MFSSRLPSVLTPNALARAAEAVRASGVILLDLTVTNPTETGIPYPPGLLSSLDDARARRYRPEPLGHAEARTAIAAQYGKSGPPVSAGDLVLTASTSEAYSVLFKLLADPGDVVLVPQPSYPLFDLLTRLDGVVARPYRLEYHGAWSIDRASLEQGLQPDVRAVLVVSPNNPTGSMLRRADREWLADLCASRGAALIADEVFADYPLSRRPDAASLAGDARALTFTLGGLSKSAGLPQLKLGWIVVSGPTALRDDAMARLDVICDTYLSVSTPVQIAAPVLLEHGRAIRAAIQDRITRNLSALRADVARVPAVTLLEPEGGWSVVLRVPAVPGEEAFVLRLLQDDHVVVHPGYFFDFSEEAFLVVSLLPDAATFDDGVMRLLRRAADGTR